MNLQFFEPLAPLKGYIDKIWVLESDCGLPQEDMKMLVPDGRLLLLLPLKNAMVGKMGGRIYSSKENRISLVGISDMPSVVDTQDAGVLGVLGVDFTPVGAYRFFRWKLKDIKNELNSLSDILGKEVRCVEEKIANVENIEGKVRILQQFLFDLFTKKSGDPVFEYCIEKIRESRGSIPVKELEQQTGYSSRWLNRKFDEMLGISPKNFSSIARFNFYYQALLTNAARILTHKEFYDHYYDESHFIREFKRFTGMPPAKLEHAVNNFGKLFL
jgi:AraC-like DNA-binding protein